MPKEGFREYCAGRRLSSITMGIGSSESILKQSQISIFNKNLYEGDFVRKPADYGILDRRLGTNQKDADCATCGLNLADCVGHYGYIDLELPVFHVGYFTHVINILKTICKKCSRILLDENTKKKFYFRIINNPNLTYTQKKNYRKQILDRAQKVHNCPYCKYKNGIVKKVTPAFKLGTLGKPVLKIVHVQYRSKEVTEKMLEDYKSAIELNSDLKSVLKADVAYILTPVDVLKLFERISVSDMHLLLMDNTINHPKDLILTRLIVPPVCIRPSVKSDFRAGTTEDDLTMKLNEIILMNNYVKKHKHLSQVNTNITLFYDSWDMLQIITALYINSEMSGVPYSMMPKKNGRGLIQRIKGKKGRIRGNLSGKRVDFTSRTVISPDPYLDIDQIGVPMHVAKILTFPQQVTEANIKLSRQLVKNGPNCWPGANYIIFRNKEKKYLRYGNREKFASDLQPGDVVERHLSDNDIVLFNRQPSLHILSIMSLRVKVHKYKTFRFNECNCTPYNADFDGDEMNVHLPQSLEAKAEAAILMANKNNLVTPKNGEILIGAIQDFLTSSFLLTKRNQFFDYNHALKILSVLFSKDDPYNNFQLPKPAILFPKQLWTGKQLISFIMRPNKQSTVKVNLVSPGKVYTSNREFCINESYVIIRNSELLAGVLDKSHLGSSGKIGNIFYLILRDYGEDYAIKAMSRLAKLSSYFLTNNGLSLGIKDVTASKELEMEKKILLKKGYEKCESIIKDMNEGKLLCQPGCDAEQTLEAIMLNELSIIRDDSGKSCSQKLPRNNAPLIMAVCGSKGSLINVAQMIMCVGQQAINSKRVPDHFDDRPLFYFERKVKYPKAKGFVENSFYSGLNPPECTYHSTAGREGLVDTAVKTAETGYMQRRLVKCLEDLTVSYDNTVRNSENEVVQFIYGGDGLNPALMEGNDVPINFTRLFQHVKASFLDKDGSPLAGNDLIQISEEYLESIKCEPGSAKDVFRDSVKEFLKNEQSKIDKCLSKYGIAGYLVERVTRNQLMVFIDICFKKYEKALVEPLTAVGALAATSIGEPGTQMTLKTFHFAGVASMNITQGVPRIKEIINVNKNISTPIIQAALLVDNDEEYAQRVKARIEKTTLDNITLYCEEGYNKNECFSHIKLNLAAIESLKQNIDAEYVRQKILKYPKLKLTTDDVYVKDNESIIIYPNYDKTTNLNAEMYRIKEHLNNILISGSAAVSRAVVTPTQKNNETKYHLCVESENLRDVMATYGVNANKTTSNHIYDVYKTLGIEACKTVIMDEIKMVMENHGMSVDIRHIMLLASQMTHTGEVLGITRYGLAKMKQSVLNLASFEQTADHLFDAGYHGQKDRITGVSENVITGMPAPIGTGTLELLEKKCFKMPTKHKVPIFQKHFRN